MQILDFTFEAVIAKGESCAPAIPGQIRCDNGVTLAGQPARKSAPLLLVREQAVHQHHGRSRPGSVISDSATRDFCGARGETAALGCSGRKSLHSE